MNTHTWTPARWSPEPDGGTTAPENLNRPKNKNFKPESNPKNSKFLTKSARSELFVWVIFFFFLSFSFVFSFCFGFLFCLCICVEVCEDYVVNGDV
jgi:hypothetical protein